MSEQRVLKASADYEELDAYLQEVATRRILLVCDGSIQFLRINQYFEKLEERIGVKVFRFSDFKPNPLYESVVAGVEFFHAERCEGIIAVGGGSAMDVAKCIKLYANMDSEQNYLEQEIIPNQIPLLAVPTTAGTGSEATRYAVIYYQGEKQSVSEYSCIPQAVLMDASVLKTLPEYQKKSTMLDALCHAVEAFWSVNATAESQTYSREAIRKILENKDDYLKNEDSGNAKMLEAANLAGKAINITQTTAGHAMCYKLTSLYGIAHGHAAALCVSRLFPYMVENVEKCIDLRGEEYLHSVFAKIADAFGSTSIDEAIRFFQQFVENLGLAAPAEVKESDFEILRKSVNPVRLKNNPVFLDEAAIEQLYHEILQ